MLTHIKSISMSGRYVCVIQKAYQVKDSVLSSVSTKVKGFSLTNASGHQPQFWDTADYTIPPQVPKLQKLCLV